ncbi:MurT ligase domain-containing protein [Carboxydochorda subterranea]|uniref:Lipid II isoglutaminyl synthase (glutamine-hydrolyzing) subunit MurT n=1 Tax=Carboxydichorda subterranea TaxID=3109565 RepID=A0ABZ1BZR0_9FIRM|nr:MurT ligase domain-containing protein [Limnochorda sp. L945t]WRP18093.1 MurT ligase domain-containing protein [Limnochorda sp. L945t]
MNMHPLRLALWAGKVAMVASRQLGRGGTAWPGRVAAAIDPDLLDHVARLPRQGTVVVTGTNGKTTTALLLHRIASRRGLRLIHNVAGANLPAGLLAAFIEGAGWWRAEAQDLAVLEVDEGAFPSVVGALRPRAVIVTNFFRDQLDRYGEVDGTVRRVREGIARAGEAVHWFICADDPLSVWLGEEAASAGQRVTYFGVQRAPELPAPAGPSGARPPLSADGTQCVRCGTPYRYERLFYAQLGHYACPNCGHRRPLPQVQGDVEQFGEDGAAVVGVSTSTGQLQLRLRLPGIHNVYNALAAASAALALEFGPDEIAQGLEEATVPFGRTEEVWVRGRRVVLSLVKNPTSFDQVLATVAPLRPWRCVAIALNDLAADGRDVSWIWDVDFEGRLVPRLPAGIPVICTGRRAADMAVRLKYAGVEVPRLVIETRLGEAIRQCLERATSDEPVWILATYTAMLSARKVLVSSGLPRPAPVTAG